jgi:hypothetical protein
VLVLEAGPMVLSPGLNLLNLDPAESDLAYDSLARVPSRSGAGGARPGMRLVDPAGDLPSAKYACNVGGMAAHWTCACPRPGYDERTSVIRSEVLDTALLLAEPFLGVRADPFPPNPSVSDVLSALTRAFPDLRRQVRALPMAMDPLGESGQQAWNGVETILAPALIHGATVLTRALARRLRVCRDQVTRCEGIRP